MPQNALLLILLAHILCARTQFTSVAVDQAIHFLETYILTDPRIDLPGFAIGITHEGQVKYAKGYGVRDTSESPPRAVDADTSFAMASVSKVISASVLADLMRTCPINWSTPLRAILPDFRLADPAARSLTIKDAFCHRSGMPEHIGDLLEDIGYDRAEVLHRLRYHPPAYAFRDGYAYTNLVLTAGAVAAAQGCGTSFEEACQAFFAPRHMDRSTCRQSEHLSQSNRAVQHIRIDGRWAPNPQQEQTQSAAPAGGVYTTIRDMMTWMQFMLGEGPLGSLSASPAFQQIRTPQNIITGLPLTAYGLGVNVGTSPRYRLSHSGAFALGAATVFELYPNDHIGIAVFSNGNPLGIVEGIAAEFMDALINNRVVPNPDEDLLGKYMKAFTDPALIGIFTSFDYLGKPVSEEEYKKPSSLYFYAGVYSNKYYGEAVVEVSRHVRDARVESPLNLYLGPTGTEAYEMFHYTGDVWYFKARGENAPEPNGMTGIAFGHSAGVLPWIPKRQRNGSFTIEYLDQTNLGTFKNRWNF